MVWFNLHWSEDHWRKCCERKSATPFWKIYRLNKFKYVFNLTVFYFFLNRLSSILKNDKLFAQIIINFVLESRFVSFKICFKTLKGLSDLGTGRSYGEGILSTAVKIIRQNCEFAMSVRKLAFKKMFYSVNSKLGSIDIFECRKIFRACISFFT